MRRNLQKLKADASTGVRLESVLDIVTTCPKCGGEIGLWSEDTETLCIFCQYRLFEKEGTVH
jgi:DNA-directed RNA polymerase subunit RPC12/RpoP